MFSPSKPSSYYRGQLSSIYKRQNEHILDYIGKIKDLKTAIIEGEKREGKPVDLTLDNFTLDSFLEGLPSEQRLILKMEGYKSLNEAFTKSVSIFNKSQIERERERVRERENPRNYNFNNNQNFNGNSNNRNNISSFLPNKNVSNNNMNNTSLNRNSFNNNDFRNKPCSYCGKIGHTADFCFKNPQRKNGNVLNENHNFGKYCKYCKRNGHLVQECRTLAAMNSRNSGNGPGLPLKDASRENPDPTRQASHIKKGVQNTE
ncbi:hypothetical protein WN55_07096 [Dufourea novaeangliae]|uniref:CCHC-type domain-containing protein n=1 Tax=Dufourea novaeangliae TaxID=178035 RepID=A0A154PRG3_DUFNO|nr:hypothetical protein WN55_07096 [Dufourea novaeangliae]